MKIMNRPRGGGKTYEMIRALVFNKDAVLVVATAMHKRHVIHAAEHQFPHVDRKFWEEHVIYAESMEKLRGRILANTTVYVDNVEFVLSVFLGQTPHIVTTTSEAI